MTPKMAFLTMLVFGVAELGVAGLATAQVQPPAAQPPAPPPQPNPFPVGGTDNISNGDYVIQPDYVPAAELKVPAANATGSMYEITLLAQDSKLYPGRKHRIGYVMPRTPQGSGNAAPGAQEWEDAPYEPRHVWVYVPAGTKPETPMPILVVMDGRSYQDRLHRILDNMIAQKRVPAMVVVAIEPGSTPVGSSSAEDGQGSERGYEYDTMSGRYSDFVETEVLPRVSKQFHITFTKDPEGRATMGGSSGAAAAFSMAWYHPERYHRTILYSPTFVNQQSPFNPETPHGAWEYHDHLIAQTPKKPIRVWMEVGENDNHFDDPDSTFHNWVTAANRSAAAFKAKGYDYRFVFAKAARHVDGRVVDQTLPAALEYIWQGYKPSGR